MTMNDIERLERENARLRFILDDNRNDLQDIIDLDYGGVKFGLFGNAPRTITRMLVHAFRARMMIDNFKAEEQQPWSDACDDGDDDYPFETPRHLRQEMK